MRRLCYLLIAALLVPFLQGCPKPAPKIKEEYEVNKWIYSQMAKYYLWREELPSFDDSDPATATQTYFDINLRYRYNNAVSLNEDYRGDRFSYIEYTGDDPVSRSRAAETEREYDFGFLLSRIVNRDKTINHLQILYVNPGAPADRAGLRRGDTFDKINGEKVTNENMNSLLSGTRITVNVLNRETGGEIAVNKAMYYDQPILLDTIYQDVEPKTAYLIYNHFTNGDDMAGYAAKLKAAFGRYKSEGVENLILDLRYNGGGEVENARLLASLIAPSDMLGKEFMRMQRNDAVTDWNKFDKYYLFSTVAGENADIKNLYVITSQNTASASELIIHTMRPILDAAGRLVYTVGQTTYGKNLGSITYTNSQYDWELSPICMRVYNIKGVSEYELGLEPDTGRQDDEYVYFQEDDYYTLPPLGDYEHEKLLNIVFQEFTDVTPVTRSAAGTRSSDMPRPVPMVRQRGLSGGIVLID